VRALAVAVPTMVADPTHVEGDFVELMNRTPKVVFSTTLTEPLAWQRATLNRGELAVEIPRLKRQPGKDVGAWGSVALVGSRVLDDRVVLLDYQPAR
jgi:hypothetical protein